jgi:hypothetical protein
MYLLNNLWETLRLLTLDYWVHSVYTKATTSESSEQPT